MTEAWLERLTLDECLDLLRSQVVGRLAVIVDGFPAVLPVNYRLVETGNVTWIALRTRPGNVIERAPLNAAFEIDQLDLPHRGGWSVLARGTLHPVDPDVAEFRELFDPEPWLEAERDAWLIVQPFAITGRRLHPTEPAWAFSDQGYL
jgi:nitroimidazol reductase NimA-like FMN-containing flavoprotein (pyridoxamine 5'-phosphate oxidase superfamily)